MRRTALWGALTLALAGCTTLDAQEDLATFAADGAFEAALAAGARVHDAAEDPSDPDRAVTTLPFAADDVDSSWGVDRTRLRSIHWWGPGEAPPLGGGERGDGVTVANVGNWQGFLLQPDHLQVLPGDVPRAELERLADQFLANTTDLSPHARAALIDQLLGECSIACTTQVDAGLVDGGKAWAAAGGLTARSGDRMGPSGPIALGDWWFDLAVDEAVLQERAGEGTVTATIGANDVVAFSWRSGQQHSDDESGRRLAEALDAWGLPGPQGPVRWTHQAVESD